MKHALQTDCRFWFQYDEEKKANEFGYVIDFDGRFYHDEGNDTYHYHVTNTERKNILVEIEKIEDDLYIKP